VTKRMSAHDIIIVLAIITTIYYKCTDYTGTVVNGRRRFLIHHVNRLSIVHTFILLAL